MNIADRIQRLRKTKGISQEQLAEIIGVSRQAVSKWESEQSTPDIEKIILLSNYFEVTTDYLLKGIEPEPATIHRRLDARIFAILATALNAIGLILAIMIWKEKQDTTAVTVGLTLMIMGCVIFVLGQILGEHIIPARKYFLLFNVWFLLLIPISCVFNFVSGTLGGFWWTFTPLPQLGNSRHAYLICWLVYFVLCMGLDSFVLFYFRRKNLVLEEIH